MVPPFKSDDRLDQLVRHEGDLVSFLRVSSHLFEFLPDVEVHVLVGAHDRRGPSRPHDIPLVRALNLGLDLELQLCGVGDDLQHVLVVVQEDGHARDRHVHLRAAAEVGMRGHLGPVPLVVLERTDLDAPHHPSALLAVRRRALLDVGFIARVLIRPPLDAGAALR